jgi:hypothetical protein
MEDYKDLIAVAQAETGLGDFGGDTFREGLEILLGALNREAKLNAVGESVLRERIVGHLKQRLQVEDCRGRGGSSPPRTCCPCRTSTRPIPTRAS